jgi:hypothetical protein
MENRDVQSFLNAIVVNYLLGFTVKLQPALLCVYDWALTWWHKFLYQLSKAMPCAGATILGESAGSLSPAH